ncbi:MAG: hypothetical protein P8H21_01065 [Woeseiaceae bacterium]|jgi:hypothetical protein|nr:hypothetical protein [Woeseiaceae bacterium]
MAERLNLAMWSGPRNLSTALMRSFGNREDVIEVIDEPFYASYLKESNKKHPMYKEVLDSQESNWKMVVKNCLREDGMGICYQKHMVQHILPNFEKKWILKCLNCFLIREPKEVISSFLKKWPDADFEDFGFLDQINLFHYIKNESGMPPVVIDAANLRDSPETYLPRLCSKLNISWDPKMLQWDAGLKPYDGIWASHWYPSVNSSTGFKKNIQQKEFSDTVLNFAAMAKDSYHELLTYKI